MPNPKRIYDKVIEHEEAPSGYVTMYRYKEPLMKFKEGFGFQGVLLMNGDGDSVQCHYCGEWMEYLPNHIKLKHGLNAKEYKHNVGLLKSTALISESFRQKIIESKPNLDQARLLNAGPKHHWFKKTEEQKNAIRKKITRTLKANYRERQNVTGTCPEQLIDRLKKLQEKLGRAPKVEEIPFRKTLIRVYGSVAKARKLARVGNYNYLNHSTESIIQRGVDFYRKNKRVPRSTDYLRKVISPSYTTVERRFGTFRKFQLKVLQASKK